MLTRRSFLATAAAAGTAIPGVTLASAPGEQRFIFIFLRGAMDGLAAVPPIGDPDYAAVRGRLAFTPDMRALPLHNGFALHPAMTKAHALYQSGELLVAHAIAPPHRTRSHFDAQNILENGATRAFARDDGWLNRALSAMGGDRADLGLAIAESEPLTMRGPAKVAGWAPRRVVLIPETLSERVSAMYAADPVLAPAFAAGLNAHALASANAGSDGRMGGARGGRALVLAENAGLAAEFLARPDGPRIAMLEGGQWDTHAGQGVASGRMARLLGDLSAAFERIKIGLGPAWRQTVVVAATEFGRTARPNGALGTDHGYGSATFIAGGAVNGGKVIADWPGMSQQMLFEGRDLMATMDMRALLKGVLVDHLQVSQQALDARVFPESAAVRPIFDIIRH